jgi:hypothetical protein
MSLAGDSRARVLFLPLVVAVAVVSCGARTDLAVGLPQLDAGEDVAMGEDSGCGGGGTARVVATFGTGDLAPDVFTFAIAEGFAFVETGASGNPLAIVRAPLGGGAAVTAVAGQPPGCGTASMSPFGYESLRWSPTGRPSTALRRAGVTALRHHSLATLAPTSKPRGRDHACLRHPPFRVPSDARNRAAPWPWRGSSRRP